jgi:hypothetical protein
MTAKMQAVLQTILQKHNVTYFMVREKKFKKLK